MNDSCFYLILLTAFSCTAANSSANTTEQSGFKCATKCAALQPCDCAAFTVARETKLCLMSAVWGADFSAAAPGGPVYRRRLLQSKPYACVSNRIFEYEAGFGDGADFWIGLRSIHELTGSAPKLLRVEAVTWSDVLFVAEYSGFTVGDASTSYTMTFGSYLTGSSNMSSDSLSYHKGMQFSTKDRDNDMYGSGSCSRICGFGGWWYKMCASANPNGMYRK